MATADLQGPLDDFYERTLQIRAVLVAIEVAVSSPGALTTTRNIDLTKIGRQTENTVTAMSLVFLASSFEEFVREEIIQCSGYMADRYKHLGDAVRHGVRNSYWAASIETLRFNRSILTTQKPQSPDATVVSRLRVLLDSVLGFVVGDDAAHLESSVFVQHSNNFRPHVVDAIAKRLGISQLMLDTADSSKLKAYFGVTKKADAGDRLRIRLNEFYDRRNAIVHSLNGSSGYAVDVILDYVDLFEATAESIKNVLTKNLAKW